MSIKLCKLCSGNRYGNSSWCYKHYQERLRLKRQEKAERKLANKIKTKRFQLSLKKKLHNKAWKLMSEWIRRKDANLDGFNYCYTCEAIKHYKDLDAGHFRHDKLDFDDRNLKPQCTKCNRYYSGMLDIYAYKLLKDYGKEWFDKLVKDSWEHIGYSCEELRLIIIDLRDKISKL